MPQTVLLEVEWVLRGVYGMAPAQIITARRALAGSPGVSIEDAPFVARAMAWTEAGMDFAGALRLEASAACEGCMTFTGGCRGLVPVWVVFRSWRGLRIAIPQSHPHLPVAARKKHHYIRH